MTLPGAPQGSLLAQDSLYSPSVEKIEVKSSHRARCAKLYYLRDRSGKSARLVEIRE